MAKLAASKTATDDTPVAPKDISGDVTTANVIGGEDSHSPRSKRKRAGDFFDFEEDEAVVGGGDKESESTPAQPTKKPKTASVPEKKTKPSKSDGKAASGAEQKKTKSTKGDEQTAPKAEKKTKPKNDDGKTTSSAEKKIKPRKEDGKTAAEGDKKKTRPSKEDGHPVVTEKTHPGGDMVEMEPKGKSKAQKKDERKAGKKETAAKETAEKETAKPDANKDDSSKVKAKATKVKKAPEPKEQASAEPKSHAKKGATDKARKTSTSRPDGDKASLAPDAEELPAQAHADQDASATKKSKDKKENAKPKAEAKKSSKDADVEVKDDSASKKAKAPKPSKPAKAGKSSDAKSKPEPAESSNAAPEQAMDEAPFKKLVQRERAKIPAVKASANKAEAERKAMAAKKADKPAGRGKETFKAEDSKSAPSQEPAKAVAGSTAESSAKTEAPKGQKRKDGPDAPDVQDAKTDSGPSGKKQKKSRKSALDVASSAVGDLVNSGIEAAAQGVSAVKDLASGFGNKSIADDVTAVAEGVVEEKAKKTKKAQKDAGKEDDESKKGKGKEKAVEDKPVEDDFAGLDDSEDEDEDSFEEGDQTLALIKGFESEGDEEHPGDDSGFKEGTEVPDLPSGKDLSKKLKAAKDESGDGPGVIYVGRIPHGFYEPQMRAYFSQFGTLLRLRLSRNRTTGASKHYAFLEFASAAVASIVAETMNNYLMFGHILKVRVVPREQVHENLWKGAGKRFKKVPWARLEGRRLEVGVSKEKWAKRVEVERKRRSKKGDQLKEIGYEFEAPELKAPEVKGVKEGDGEVVEEKTVVTTDAKDGKVVISEEVKMKKTKKVGKRKVEESEKDGEAVAEGGKEAKKAKKTAAA